jgi:purine-binding chemotaxis protein CheW
MADETSVLVFRIADEVFALPIAHVVEVAAMVALTQLQGTADAVLGLANRRGQPLVVVDLRRIIGQNPLELTPQTLFIVIQYNGKQIGAAVDAVLQVAHVPSSTLQAVATSDFVQAVINYQDDLLKVLAVPTLIEPYAVIEGNGDG